MVVCKIELWPGGDKDRARPLGVIAIANDRTGDESHGNYDIQLSHAGMYWGKPGSYKVGRVQKFRRSPSPYHLVARALIACGIK